MRGRKSCVSSLENEHDGTDLLKIALFWQVVPLTSVLSLETICPVGGNTVEIQSLTVSERILLAEALWDSIVAEQRTLS